jgi:recombination DNA repair RAD52 pathway protein
MSIEIKLTFETTAGAVAFLSNVLTAETPAPAQHSAAKAKAEQPKAEQPKAEQPKAEQPKAEQSKAEQSKAEQSKSEPKAEPGIDYDTDIKPRVLKVAKRPVVGMPMIQHLFARAGVSNAQQIKPEYYPHFLKLLDLADAADDEEGLQDAIAALHSNELAV